MTEEQNKTTVLRKTQPEPLLEVRNITKRFPGVLALDDVSLKFMQGEVHAVVGENGAGKSTLMKIMAGAYIADSGEILLQGKKVSFSHPQEAHEQGVSIIYQEFNLLPERTVAQNIYLGREPSKFGVIDIRALNKKALTVLKELGADEMISPTALCNTLSVAEQQIVEIAKAISFDSKVLIMDEPTAALTLVEVRILNALVSRLKTRGMALIFISHRLVEVFDIADKITVLKDGQLVGTELAKDVNAEKIVHMMVGRILDHYFPPLGKKEDFGEVVLRVNNCSNHFLKNINLELRKGEVLGIAGLQGSGRTELAQALFGVMPFKTGTMEINGKTRTVKAPSTAIKYSMGFMTEDRKAEGLLPKQPIRDNMLLTVRSMQSILGNIFNDGIRKSRKMVPTLAKQVDVRTDNYDREVQFLSGGNQQKVALSKWLASNADIFIFDEPTRGIDVEAKASIHDLIRGLTKKGIAVLMISSELPEIIGMSDRILVMWDGSIAGELPAKSTESDVMLLATGHETNNHSNKNDEAGKE
ncbi:MAG: ribose transport system ATP-binding protein [Chloroflexi bacterium]|nr:MAG: ribose transport system ATP-binding protein [Chloroflexota bacterium]MBA4376247.1 sugar ABC transporter ATP-binding protein [Anaerolinea sp.]